MSAESQNQETPQPEKLSIDNPSDFQFHAAYLAYSEAFDKTKDFETQMQLNQSIEALKQNQVDYQTFYANISKFRGSGSQNRYDRTLIKTQRKRDWRRSSQRQQRNKRHGK